MSIIAVDMETFYSVDYSLTKLSTEAYVRDKRFEVIGMGLRLPGDITRWHTGYDAVGYALRQVDWSKHSFLAFNTAFDGSILAWHYGVRPAIYLDSMGVARCCGVAAKGASLKAVCEALEVGTKGDYVVKAMGKRLRDFSANELAEYGAYCINDVDRTVDIYKKLMHKFPHSEVLVQDKMLRMFFEPMLVFNQQVLHEHYTETVNAKQENLRKVAEVVGIEFEGEGEPIDKIKTILMSNPKFAGLLETLGVEPPLKISPTTGAETYAFAKTDPNFLELLEHDNPIISTAVAARLGIKSTIEETRAAHFIDIATRGAWPIQYNYWGAHSRFSGSGKVNPQNLKRGGRLRDALESPAGHTLITADLRQIQCRYTNYIAGQDDVVQAFRNNDLHPDKYPDIYCIAASKIFGRPITTADKHERTVGKINELSLGFGGSGKAYKRMLFSQAGIRIELPEANRAVDIYRVGHPKVQKLWYAGDDVLDALCQGLKFEWGKRGCLDGNHPEEGIGLPNGTFIRLPFLKKIMAEDGKRKFIYIHKKKPTEIYGAMLVALVMQAMERITITNAMLRIAARYQTRMMSHDELVFCIVNAEVEEAKEFIYNNMVQVVPWARDLPLACEIGVGTSYGSCK